jgi:hypothetical protein
MKIRTKVKSGSLTANHSRTAVRIRTKIRAGAIIGNHSRAGVRR